MSMARFFIGMLPVGLMVLGMSLAFGQDYPNKPIRIVAPAAGGSTDFASRIVAQELAGSLGQQVIIDNRPLIIAIETVVKAPPDGYTLIAVGQNLWLAPFLGNVHYDPVRDFLPITLLASQPNILVVHPSVPAKSVKDLIALAKARPGELNYGSSSIGATTHLAAELFKAMAGVNMVHIPYKGSGPAVIDLIGGQVQLMFSTSSTVMPHVKSGRLRALAVSSARPSVMFPDYPTVAAAGLPGYESVSTIGLLAPAKTPAAIINRLNQETVRVLNRSDVKEKCFGAGVEAPGGSPEEFAATIKSDMARMGKVIRDAGIRY